MKVDRRETFLDVGERLFSKYGYRTVNVDDIASSAGVATGSFYSYFKSKESFYNEIIERTETKGRENAEQIIARLQSPLNKLKALYRSVTLSVKKNKILQGSLLLDKRYIFPGFDLRQHRGEDLRSHLELMIAEIVSEGRQLRVFRADLFKNPEQLIMRLFEMNLMNLESDNSEELMHDTLMLLERGLKRWLRLRKREERTDRRVTSREHYSL